MYLNRILEADNKKTLLLLTDFFLEVSGNIECEDISND